MMNNKNLYIIVIILSLGLCYGCTSVSKPKEKKPVVKNESYEEHSPSYDYTPAQENYEYTNTPVVTEEPQTQQNVSEEVQQVAAPKLSKEYLEGYDNGYADGEDDALERNGYRGQYDDSCKYKGKKRREYQLGYAEGYEAGFDDNIADDGSDDEYE